MQFIIYLHILGIAVAIGAGAAHIQLMREASKGGEEARTFILGARAVRIKTEIPGYIIALLTGITLVVMNPGYLKGQGWLHAKLTLVVILLGFLHLEGRKIRGILRTFTEGDTQTGMKQARSYASTFTLIPVFVVLAIVYIATYKPF